MKKEPSKGWLDFRDKAGEQLKGAGARAAGGLSAGAKRSGAWVKDSFRVEKGDAAWLLTEGLFFQNPLLVLTLGVTCALASSAELKSAVAMGGCTLLVLLCSALVISLTRNILPAPVRRVGGLAIVAAFTTAVGMVFQVLAPNRAAELGIYLPLIAVNTLLLTRAAAFDAENKPGRALVDALGAGVGYALALALLGLVREALGSGSVWGVSLFGGELHPAVLLAAPCGGFLVLGALTALVQWLKNRNRKGEKEP